MEQIVHRNRANESHIFYGKGGTLVVDLPSGGFLQNLLYEVAGGDVIGDKVIHLKIGVAVCSDKDQYNKKLGVSLARSRMKPVAFKIQEIRVKSGMSYMSLKDDSGVFIRLRFIGDHVRIDGLSNFIAGND